jgi:hypothetical protein
MDPSRWPRRAIERSAGEAVAEHRQPAQGFGLCRFVLEDVPVLGELAVFEADDVDGDPGGRAPDARETAVGDDVVAFGDDQLVLVAQRRRSRADEVEQSPAAGRDMGAVLDVAIRPPVSAWLVSPRRAPPRTSALRSVREWQAPSWGCRIRMARRPQGNSAIPGRQRLAPRLLQFVGVAGERVRPPSRHVLAH